MKWLLQLYPTAWRRRYGEEFASVLQRQRLSLGLAVDVLGGAVDAWLHPQIEATEREIAKGEKTMTNEMIERCAAGGPKLSQRDQILASAMMLLGALIMAIAYLVLAKLYHTAPAVQALGYMTVPAILQFFVHAAYLRHRPISTQLVVTSGALAFIYLIMWGACEVAVRL
jgi:drug/metabolite transporter (DMT)-like permease